MYEDDKFKPCPLCGGKVYLGSYEEEISPYPYIRWSCEIICSKCGSKFEMSNGYRNRQASLLDMWNGKL